ncbi:MAG: DUF1850 domain-containing protein [Synergistaceae bacterium]|jgi:hypothetical protein|nr:DUF1850 domain-containing protein [Synergistaceae bacterium]
MKHAGNQGAGRAILRVLLMIACGAFFAPSMPVNYLTASGRGELLFSCPVPNGYPFVTICAHSPELTPVADDYRLTGGMIWGWEERARSHTDGGPSVATPHSAFAMSPPWMIHRGGRMSYDVINYRVGNEKSGRNVWHLRPWKEINMFEKYPSYRIAIESSVVPLKNAASAGFDTIGDQPNADRRIISM